MSQLLDALQKNVAATAEMKVYPEQAQREYMAKIAAEKEKQLKEQLQKAQAKAAEAERELEKRRISEPKAQ